MNRYKLYRPTQLSIKKLLLKAILHHISQVYVSTHFYGAFFRLNFFKNYCIQFLMPAGGGSNLNYIILTKTL
jgi:hypothetical protein